MKRKSWLDVFIKRATVDDSPAGRQRLRKLLRQKQINLQRKYALQAKWN